MVVQMVSCGPLIKQPGHVSQLLAMVLIVFAPVVELLADARADLNDKAGSNGDVSIIKEFVHIRPKQQTIGYMIRPGLCVWFDVRRFQNR